MAGLFDRLQEEIEDRERMEGLSPADLLGLSDELRNLVQTIAREGDMSLAEIVMAIDMSPSEATQLLEALEEKGFVRGREVDGEMRYKTYFARRRSREVPLNIWDALSDKINE